MESVSPVWTEKEVEAERVVALDQPEYKPVIMLPIQYECKNIDLAVRFRLTDAERKAITEGADILVEQMNFGNPFIPIIVEVAMPGEYPEREKGTDHGIRNNS